MSIITYLHPYKAGDLIALLPGIKHQYDLNGTKAIIYQRIGMPAYYEEFSKEQCMSVATFNMIKPLIESQEYIERFQVWEGEEAFIDTTHSRDSRVIPMPNGSIHHWTWAIFPDLQCNLFVPWLDVPESPDPFFHNKVIINRTSRYQNPNITYYFLKQYQDQILFFGAEAEHSDFCNDFNLELTLLKPDNFFELAKIIKACKFFLGNQSMAWHIADAMKATRLLECSTLYPNTFPTGHNGYIFYYQKTLELQFERLIR